MKNFNDKYPQLKTLIEFQALEASSMGIVISDPRLEGNPIIYCNGTFLRISGYDREEVLGKNCRFMQGAETDANIVEKIRIGLNQQCEFKVVIKNYRKNKSAFWNELSISPIKDSQGQLLFFIGFQYDITERVLIEESLNLSRVRQNEMIEASGDFFWEINKEGNFVYLSNKVEDTLGYYPKELYGKSIFDYLVDDDSENNKQILEELLNNSKAFRNIKLNLITKDNSKVWIRLNGTPRFNSDTFEFQGFIGSGGDITNEQYQLMEIYRLSTLGEVAAEIAHEIFNPLTVINSHVVLLEKNLKSTDLNFEKLNNSVEKIKKMVLRTQKIISGAKAMAKNAQNDTSEPISIKEIIEESLELCNGKIKNVNAQIELVVVPENYILNCRPIQISQIIINLISNACDAILEQPNEQENCWIKIQANQKNNGMEILFSNSGKNAFESLSQALNNPYQSGKSGKGGTGIGLHLIKKILKLYDATIKADPVTPNTCIIIYLPNEVQEKNAA